MGATGGPCAREKLFCWSRFLERRFLSCRDPKIGGFIRALFGVSGGRALAGESIEAA